MLTIIYLAIINGFFINVYIFMIQTLLHFETIDQSTNFFTDHAIPPGRGGGGTEDPENDTLMGGTSLYTKYMGVIPL